MKKLETKPRCSEQTVSNKVRGVSPGARRFVKEVGLEPGVKERELWMVRLVS